LRQIAGELIAYRQFLVNARLTGHIPNRGGKMAKTLAPGDPAPKFRLETDQGPLSSSDLKGSPYVLYFYPKDDTSGCTKEAQAFSENKAKFKSLGVEILGVSKDSTESHEKFRKKYGLKIRLGSDPEKEMAEAYGVWIQKSLYGRSYMGMDRATFLVDGKGIIRRIWRKVKVPGHAEAVLAAAKELATSGRRASAPVNS
jgi:peroxiredoxin